MFKRKHVTAHEQIPEKNINQNMLRMSLRQEDAISRASVWILQEGSSGAGAIPMTSLRLCSIDKYLACYAVRANVGHVSGFFGASCRGFERDKQASARCKPEPSTQINIMSTITTPMLQTTIYMLAFKTLLVNTSITLYSISRAAS